MKPPIIIIGAGRSGTKILRDILCAHSKLVTWPCDEINPIWRHDHANYPTDELKPEQATPKIKKYIRSKFKKILKKYNGERVVEKTCANALRINYVYEIFPNAQFIHLIRDGRDVAESARKRWKGDVKISYIIKKGRYIPFFDIPYYAFQFISNRFQRILNKKNQPKTWGPIFFKIEEIAKTKDLIETCGIQWRECVNRAKKDFQNIPSSQIYEIKYEELVKNPQKEFRNIFNFLNLNFEENIKSTIIKKITNKNIGKWKKNLSQKDIDKLMPHIKDLMIELKYINK